LHRDINTLNEDRERMSGISRAIDARPRLCASKIAVSWFTFVFSRNINLNTFSPGPPLRRRARRFARLVFQHPVYLCACFLRERATVYSIQYITGSLAAGTIDRIMITVLLRTRKLGNDAEKTLAPSLSLSLSLSLSYSPSWGYLIRHFAYGHSCF